MLRHRREVAAWYSVTPDIPLFEMRYVDGQRITFPFRRSKTAPCVGRVFRWMWTPIKVINVVHRTQPFRMECRDLPRYRVNLFPNVQIRWPSPYVIRRMRPALPLWKRLDSGVPGIRAHSCRLGDRQTEVIAKLRTGSTLGLVLVE